MTTTVNSYNAAFDAAKAIAGAKADNIGTATNLAFFVSGQDAELFLIANSSTRTRLIARAYKVDTDTAALFEPAAVINAKLQALDEIETLTNKIAALKELAA